MASSQWPCDLHTVGFRVGSVRRFACNLVSVLPLSFSGDASFSAFVFNCCCSLLLSAGVPCCRSIVFVAFYFIRFQVLQLASLVSLFFVALLRAQLFICAGWTCIKSAMQCQMDAIRSKFCQEIMSTLITIVSVFWSHFFPSIYATVSVFWSPFLVKGIQLDESKGINHNTLYLDTPNEKWATELDMIDIVVFSNGHWFVQKAIYYGEGNQLLGCNFAQEINCTDYNIFDAFRKVLRTSLKEVTKRFYKSDKTVVVATFTLAHFEGEWKFGTCLKTEPYKEGDAEMPHLENEMRKLAIKEAARAVKDVKEMNGWLRIEALDVTKLTFLRPDGHPGPYMFPNPFANGIKEGVPNDCVHWCMPGPIDTWNAILLDRLYFICFVLINGLRLKYP
ncbi:Protein trichome birefringence [Rhynchospora pubera]|uniref:Protein trichome birefringence n=1 Tax=Rhynchospora pubera TaxID=906938 RepID=A0AAV8HU03_9POAL|nr:Protein trichome birefringence [Rhynchospora pubera]